MAGISECARGYCIEIDSKKGSICAKLSNDAKYKRFGSENIT